MAENTVLNVMTGGDIISTDVITVLNGTGIATGEKAQRVKVGWGAQGAFNDTTAANPLPITLSAAQMATLTPFGTVAVGNFPATQAISAAALPLPSGAATSANQATELASLATIATNTSAGKVTGDTTASGTLGALNAAVTLATNGVGTSIFELTNVWVGTVTFEGSNNGFTTAQAIAAIYLGGLQTQASTTTTNGFFSVITAGFAQVRARMSAYTSGSATVLANGSSTTRVVVPVQGNPNNLQVLASQADSALAGTISATDVLGGVPNGTGGLISIAPTASSFVAAAIPGGSSGISVQILGTATGTYYFEYSMDSTTGSDGGWITGLFRQAGNNTTVLVSGATTNGVFRGDCAEYKWVRIRNVGGTTPSNAISIRTGNGTGATFLNAGLAPSSNTIGNVKIVDAGGTNQAAIDAAGNQAVKSGSATGSAIPDTAFYGGMQYGANLVGFGAAGNSGDAVNGSGQLATMPWLYNGSSYDRARSSGPTGTAAVAGTFLEQNALSAGSLNADLVPSTDVSSYREAILQTAGAFVGTLTFQGSNDNITFFGLSVVDLVSNNSTPNSGSASIYLIQTFPRYIRVRMTSYTSGTATGVLELRTVASGIALSSTNKSNQNGAWNVGSSASTGSGVPSTAFYLGLNNAGNLSGVNATSNTGDANGGAGTVPVGATVYNGTTWDRVRSGTTLGSTLVSQAPAALSTVTLQNAVSATGNGSPHNITGYSSAVLNILGTFVATINFDASPDSGTTWVPIYAQQLGSSSIPVTSTTTTGAYRVTVDGFTTLRARVTWTSGTSVTVTSNALVQAAPGQVQAVNQSTLMAGEDLVNNVLKVNQVFTNSYISTAATTTLKTGAGLMHTLVVQGGTAGTIIGYDNTAGSGTIVFSFDSTSALATYTFDIIFNIGLTIVTSAATKLSVGWR
jgi:hypothetical protein